MKKLKWLFICLLVSITLVFTTACISEHTHEIVHMEAKDATCTEDGNIDCYYCDGCGYYFQDEEGKVKIKKASAIISALGHDLKYYEEVAATCEEAGHSAYYECKNCGKKFADAEATTEATVETYEALGHTEQTIPAVPATCEECGQTESVVCAVCGKVLVAAQEIIAEGHTVVEDEAVPATCSETGLTAGSHCSVCGKVIVAHEEIPTIEHTYVLKEDECVEATLEANGSLVYECSACGAKKTVTLYAHQVTGDAEVTKGFNVDHRASYTFEDIGNGVYKSNNGGKGSSSAFADINITQAGTFYFTYTVSSESGWDKFNAWSTISNAYTNIINNASGTVAATTLKFEVQPGDKFTFQYSKDSGGNSGEDCAKIYDMYLVTDDQYEKYTLTFVGKDGTTIDTMEVFGGAPISADVDTTCEGYFFDAWYTEDTFENEVDFASGIEENTTVYAKYTKGVTVTFTNIGDTTVASQCVRPNAAVTVPTEIPTQNGKYFVKWAATEDGSEEFDFASGVAVDTQVYAIWRDPVVLTFNTNEGSNVEAIATDVNVAITEPAAPTKAGYRFDGWYNEEACTTAFDFAAGISENKTVYAKWVEQVTITYVEGSNTIATESIDKGAQYTAATPEGYTEIVEGFFANAELTNAYVNGTAINSATTIYIKIHKIAPDGVLTSFVNVDASEKVKAWTYDPATGNYTSGNGGIGSSVSDMTLTFAKASFVAFNYTVNSESNYDYFIIKINGTQYYSSKVSGKNGVDITGSFSYTFAAGDVLLIEYTKDSSGNQGKDSVVLSGFVCYDGVPGVTVTFNYQAQGVDNVTVDVDVNSTFASIENLASLAPADTEDCHFGGWYYDAACTDAVEDTDAILENITVYAKYLYPATITFNVNGNTEVVAPVSVWTGVAITLPENPTQKYHIFRYWMTEDLDVFDPANGVDGDVTLYAYFELLPDGANMDVAYTLHQDSYKHSLTAAATSEEFTDSYVRLVCDSTNTYFFTIDGLTKVGGNYNYTSYAKYKVITEDGTEVLPLTSASTVASVRLTAGVTYYIVTNLAVYNTYKVWGTYNLTITSYYTDDIDEAVNYNFDWNASISAGTFYDRNQKFVYKYEATTTGTYALKVVNTGWCSVAVYSNGTLSNYDYSKNCAANSTNVFDFTQEAGKTYYIVFSTNWTGSELTTKTIQMSIKEYPQGYTISNPIITSPNAEITTDFSKGANMYYQFGVSTTTATIMFNLTSSNSATKKIDVYNVNDLTTSVFSISSSSNIVKYLENLPEGNYVMYCRLSSANASSNFTVALTTMTTGTYWTTPDTLTLDESMTVNASVAGYYYTFTTGAEKLWYFFTTTDATGTIYNANRSKVGTTAIQLEANTTYFYVVQSNDATTTITLETLTEYADGKSEAGAFYYTAETATRPCGDGSYTWYYKYDCTEAGTYRFYTSNEYSIDTRVYVYATADFLNYIAYNDDDYNNHTQTTWKYDGYTEVALEAGKTYYLKVTYSNSNASASVYVGLEKVE